MLNRFGFDRPVKEKRLDGSIPIPAKEGLIIWDTLPNVPAFDGGAREIVACCALVRAAYAMHINDARRESIAEV